VDFTPFLDQINTRLGNQYELRVNVDHAKPGLANLKVQVAAPNTKTEAAQQIYLEAAH
jgi:hypothetical protein